MLPTVNGVLVSLDGHQHTIADLAVVSCAKLLKTATQTYTANIATKVTWNSTAWDLTGGFNAANSRLILPASLDGNGLFRVDFSLFLNNSSTMIAYLYINGALQDTLLSTTVSNSFFNVCGFFTATAGQYIELWIRGGTGRTIQTTSWCHIQQIG